MNVLLPTQPPLLPHLHQLHNCPDFGIFNHPSPITHSPSMMSNRKRKADEDIDGGRSTPGEATTTSYDENMSVSPTASPAIPSRAIARPTKRFRSNEISGRPLALPRLLETLDAQSLRHVLQTICERHPDLGREVVSSAPRPSVASALEVLDRYQESLREAFPFGSNAGSDYAYNRVKAALTDLIEALTDFTPHYLPPNETQTTISLSFLDGATKVIHNLPDWDNTAHRHHKDDAYDEIAKAWALVISEASKRGGGFHLHTGGWDQKLAKHNEQSGGKMQAAVEALGSNLGWIGAGPNADSRDAGSIRSQLFSGTYGSNFPVRVGPW